MWYATQARDAYPYYEHTAIGYNYRMSNVCAGIGRRHTSAAMYASLLSLSSLWKTKKTLRVHRFFE